MWDVNKLVIALILGMVEGLTEFLPISSTGHVILAQSVLGCMDDSVKTFAIIIQMGAILSITIMFWNRLCCMCVICVKQIFIKKHYENKHLCIQHILLGILPGVILGMIFYEKIRLILELIYIVYGLIIGGIFLLIGELCSPKSSNASNINHITYLQAFLIGCFQCLAFWPGFSRSGATIGGGLLVGLNRRTSSEFSFFLAIPTILGSVILTVYNSDGVCINIMDGFLLTSASIVAFVIALCTVKFFLKIVQNISLIPFVIYRFLLAGVIYWGLII